jgi:hypothetical protein
MCCGGALLCDICDITVIASEDSYCVCTRAATATPAVGCNGNACRNWWNICCRPLLDDSVHARMCGLVWQHFPVSLRFILFPEVQQGAVSRWLCPRTHVWTCVTAFFPFHSVLFYFQRCNKGLLLHDSVTLSLHACVVLCDSIFPVSLRFILFPEVWHSTCLGLFHIHAKVRQKLHLFCQ